MDVQLVYEDIKTGLISVVIDSKVVKQFNKYEDTSEYLKSIGLFVSFKKPYKSKNNKNFYTIEQYDYSKGDNNDIYNKD